MVLLTYYAFAQCPTDEADLADGGTFSGDCSVSVGFSINISGAVTWTSGTLTIVGDNGDINLSTTFDLQGGAVEFDNNDGDVDVNSGGNLIIGAGAIFTTAQELDINAGGSVTVSGTLVSESYIDVGGTLTVNSGGTITSATSIEAQSGGTINISGSVTSGTFFEIDGGDVTVLSGGALNSLDDLYIDDGGTLDIQSGATADVAGDLENNGATDGDSQGTITLDGALTVGGDVDFADTTPDSGLNGSGTLDVDGTFTDNENGDFAICQNFPCFREINILNAPTAVGNTNPFSVTFEWYSTVTGFEIGDIVVTNASTSNFVAVDGNTYTVDVTPDAGGDITIDVGANEVEEGNTAAFTVTVIYDLTGPTISFLNAPAATTTTPFTLTVKFNEDVTGFANGDINVTNATKSNFTTLDASTYDVDITADAVGDVTISIGAAAADDLSGNSSAASEVLTIPYIASAPAPGDVSTNLEVWLKTETGLTFNGSTVSDWADQSGNGNDASQATGDSQPTYTSDALNGNPVLEFDGDDVLQATAGFYTIEYFVVTVPNEIYNSGESSGTIIGFEDGTFARLGLGPTSGQITNEVITHSAGSGASYRGAFTSTTANLNQPVIMNPRENSTADGMEIYLNGRDTLNTEVNGYTNATNSYTNASYDVGDEVAGTPRYPFQGQIAEVISYSSRLSDANRRDVATYLALKYGVTLDITSQNYTLGGTAIYDASGYPNDIAGIGINNSSTLNQTNSMSVNSGAIVKIQSASDLDDGEFLIWGNNGNSNTFTTDNVPTGNSEIFEKVWTVSEFGGDGVGTVSVSFDITSLGIDIDNSTINLVTMASGQTVPDNFDTNGSVNNSGVISTVDGRTIVTFDGVDFSDGDYFTICGVIQSTSPGGSDLALWFRGDAGITSSGGLVSSWADQSGNGKDIMQGSSSLQPTLVSNAINYNDALDFNSDVLENIDGFYTNDYFAVLKPDVTISNSSTNGYILGFETQAEGGFYVGNQNIVTSDLFGQTLEAAGYDAAATAASINNDDVVVINVRNNSGATNQELFANGSSFTATTSGTFTNVSDNPIRVGNNFDNDNAFEGQIAEVISYNTRLTDNLRRDVESYLALKYGITLDLSTETSYTADSSDVFAFTSAVNDIAGIGIHLDYGLNQIQSMSQNSGAIVKMESASDLDDNEYLIWANEGSSKTTPQTSELPAEFDERLPAEWRVSEVGDPGTVTVKIYAGGIDNFSERPQSPGLYELLIDADGDFNSITSSVSASALSSDTLTFNNVTLDSGYYFTIALAPQPEVSGMALWLRADIEAEEGTSNSAENGDAVRFWQDQSGNNSDFSQGTSANRPTYATSQINGNPSLQFDGSTSFLNGGDIMDYVPQTNAWTLYTVFNSSAAGPGIVLSRALDGTQGNRQYHFGVSGGQFTQVIGGTSTNGSGTVTNNWIIASSVTNTSNTDAYIDGTQEITSGSIGTSSETTDVLVGARVSGTETDFFTGDIAEIMVYTTAQTATERRDIETYLALKYGITLDITSLNYTYNSGTSIYSLSGYSNDVAGIGSNSDFSFAQTSSSSINTGAIVAISNASSQNNNDYLIWGHDNGSVAEASTTTTGVPPGVGDRIARIWGITETNDIGTVTVVLDLSGQGYGAYSASDFTLIVDGNTDFSDGILRSYSAQSFSSDILTFATVDFSSATNFGVGTSVDLATDTDTDGIPDYFESAYGTGHNDGNDPVSGGAGGTDTNDATGTSGDGISDALENILIANGATSPVTVFSDSDSDGIPDYIEVENGSGPFNANSPTSSGDSDTDSDGLPDALEVLINSEGGPADPTLDTDTDSDGIPDYYEVINGNDPNDGNDPVSGGAGGTDTNDGTGSGSDGISDALENILIAGGTASPVEVTNDTDNDGIPDYVEAQTYTDPYNAISPIAGVTTLRSLTADYEATGGQCTDLSGYQWVDITDQSGNIVFSINPFGNNLGSTCWGIRVLSDGSNVRNSGGIYYLNRNWYIEPTTQPTGNVYVRLYSLDQEISVFTDSLNNIYGTSETTSSILSSMTVLKVNGDTELDPLTTGGSSTNETPTIVDFSAASADAFVLELSSFSTLDPQLDGDAVLPIELLSFSASRSERGVVIRWETASELNNDFFTLERSRNGEVFSEIAIVDGAGNSNERLSYDFLDSQITSGIHFYRLKQTDFDGAFTYSEIIVINVTDGIVTNNLTVYPNPINQDNFFISTSNLEFGAEFEITLLDLSGKKIRSQKLERSLNNVLRINISGIKDGVYLIRLDAGNKMFESRIVVDR